MRGDVLTTSPVQPGAWPVSVPGRPNQAPHTRQLPALEIPSLWTPAVGDQGVPVACCPQDPSGLFQPVVVPAAPGFDLGSSSLSPSTCGLSVWSLRHRPPRRMAVLPSGPTLIQDDVLSSSHLPRPEAPGGQESGPLLSPAHHVSAAGVPPIPVGQSLSGVPGASALGQLWGSKGHHLQKGCSEPQALSSTCPEMPPPVAS